MSDQPADLGTSPTLGTVQTFEQATSLDVRGEIETLVRRDLLGPWGGPTETFRRGAMGPRERYLVGLLGPRPKTTQPPAALDTADDSVDGDGSDPDLQGRVATQSLGRMWASSMGLTFCVPGDLEQLTVVATWGRYERRQAEPEEGKRPAQVWTRIPVRFERTIDLTAGDFAGPHTPHGQASRTLPLADHDGDDLGPDYVNPDDTDGSWVRLRVEIRDDEDAVAAPHPTRRVVDITLVNGQIEPNSNADTAWLFQSELHVTATPTTPTTATPRPAFHPIDDPQDTPHPPGDHARLAPGEDPEDAHLRLLYRNERRYASGRNIAVHAEVEPDERLAHALRTTWIPAYDVPETVAPTEGLGGVEFGMDALADFADPQQTPDPARLRGALDPLVSGYRAWLDTQARQIPDLPTELRPAARSAVQTARHAADRVATGIRLLGDPSQPGHAQARQAFAFANRAMADQRRRTTLGKLRTERGLGYDEALAEVLREGPDAATWRPFQLAFVLLNLPSLADPAHVERVSDRRATVDLLFFPTGGGKTEAYLGLTAFTFAIRRLQGTVGGGPNGTDARDGSAGVAVLMRYTLRLLTAQQFQRAAALVCAAELIRQADPGTWGDEPFRIGLWVGRGVSPNWYADAKKQVNDAKAVGSGKRVNALQTLACPWCGTQLNGHTSLHPDDALGRVLLFCERAEGDGACPFSARRTPEGLPIVTVDEEIYRLAPSLVVATVDKLAQLPWRGFAGILFGRVGARCERHGYRHADLDVRTGCTGKSHTPKGKLPKAVTVPVTRLRPPDLIIQDELHLISGALGTTVGLFESAVNELCSWPVTTATGERVLTSAKIVASTATTRRAAQQVLGVFGKGLAVFPPQVTSIADTYFSRQLETSQANPGRRYLGLCAHGVRLKSAQIRLAEILLLAGQTAFDRFGEAADPYLTLVGYYNATRELAGMRRYMDDDIATRVRSHGTPKGLSNRLRGRDLLAVQELTSRISSGDISAVLRQLELPFDEDFDTMARREAVAEDYRDTRRELKQGEQLDALLHPVTQRYYERRRRGAVPIDVVLATSMLQVGVDVSRFGLMVVTGQPKNTAEYIQATSRVGRDRRRPGLVLTLYNWSRPRDLAHYEDFEHYHATFYRQVEALTVTPFTRRALDRGTAGTLVAAIRNREEEFSRNADAQDVPQHPSAVEELLQRWLERAEAVHGPRGRAYLEERARTVIDVWYGKTTGTTPVSYDIVHGGAPSVPLLHRPGDGAWSTLTVGMSMRETENEINLIVPAAGHIYDPGLNVPAWQFGTANPRLDDAGGASGDEVVGDELGLSQLPDAEAVR